MLIYDEQHHVQDEHGCLSDQPFDPVEAAAEGIEEIDRTTFIAATQRLARRPPTP